jgi:hypothetical protein
VIAVGHRVRADLHGRKPELAPLSLADRAHRGLAAFAVQAVDEHHAVEVVGLVLQATGQVADAHDLDRVAASGEAPGDDVQPALGVEVQAGH